MTSLDHTQRTLWRLITTREGRADEVVRGDERFGAEQRVDVYAGMYFYRLLECLAEDFPVLHTVVGHDDFHALAADYLAAHPSEHPSVRTLGRKLADFVERHPIGEKRFWLGDLARFEWHLLEAFDAADAAAIGLAELAAVEAERWTRLRFTLTPSLRVLEASAPVDDVWNAVTAQNRMPLIDRSATAFRIWRQGLAVFHRRVDAVEVAAIGAASTGARFDEICEAAARIVGEEPAAREIVRVLGRWVNDGMIVEARDETS